MSLEQKDMMLRLKKKRKFPHKIASLKILETHISWILLTGRYVYKIKKQVKFGDVLNFSNLQLRKKFCQKEVTLNRKLCAKMYLGVVKIVKRDHEYNVAGLNEIGKPLEFAVKMLELPYKSRMDNLVRLGKVTRTEFSQLNDTLVKFHNQTNTNVTIDYYGRPKIMKAKIRENFNTLSKFKNVNSLFENKLKLFVDNNTRLFNRRRKELRIRDIHGDLHLKNIFYIQNQFFPYDRVEFNDTLRYADVAEDIAHLAMDLDYHKRKDLRENFISNYVEKSGDFTLTNIIFFFMCYKACVRAKVALFRAGQVTGRNKNLRLKYIQEADNHFKIARNYLDLF